VRIVLTSVHSWPGVRRGGERYVHELGAALRRAGHEIVIWSTGLPQGRDEVLGVPVRRLAARSVPGRYPDPWGDVAVERAFGLQAFAHLAVPAVRRRFDVWHATSTGDAAAAAAVGRLPRGPRTVFTDHGFPARRSRSARPDRREHAFVVRHVDHYVCVSAAAGDYLETDYGRRADVVPPGVRLAAHRPAAARHPRPALLYSGSLTEPRKNVPMLLDAVGLLRAAGQEVELWLLGPGDARPLLDAAGPAARAAVTRCGLVDDDELRECYARAWATVLPSRAESFGMAVAESLASGTPAVVLADGGGPAEIVSSARIGRRCEATAESLADACAETLDLATEPSVAADCRERARDFDWDAAVVPRLLDLYAECST